MAELSARCKCPRKCKLDNSPFGVRQVMQLGWDGQLGKVGSLGGGPHACLLGALADRLLVARAAPAPAGLLSLEVSPRHLPILHCLLLAWASLASLPLLPGAVCTSYACACKQGQQGCKGRCVPLSTDCVG